MNKQLIKSFLAILMCCFFSLSAMTIAEKKAQLEKQSAKKIPQIETKAQDVNQSLKRLKDRHKEIYYQVSLLKLNGEKIKKIMI